MNILDLFNVEKIIDLCGVESFKISKKRYSIMVSIHNMAQISEEMLSVFCKSSVDKKFERLAIIIKNEEDEKENLIIFNARISKIKISEHVTDIIFVTTRSHSEIEFNYKLEKFENGKLIYSKNNMSIQYSHNFAYNPNLEYI